MELMTFEVEQQEVQRQLQTEIFFQGTSSRQMRKLQRRQS